MHVLENGEQTEPPAVPPAEVGGPKRVQGVLVRSSSSCTDADVVCMQEDELNRQQRKEAAEAQRAADRQAAQQKRDEESTEKLQLLVALRTARKAKADELGQVRVVAGSRGKVLACNHCTECIRTGQVVVSSMLFLDC